MMLCGIGLLTQLVSPARADAPCLSVRASVSAYEMLNLPSPSLRLTWQPPGRANEDLLSLLPSVRVLADYSRYKISLDSPRAWTIVGASMVVGGVVSAVVLASMAALKESSPDRVLGSTAFVDGAAMASIGIVAGLAVLIPSVLMYRRGKSRFRTDLAGPSMGLDDLRKLTVVTKASFREGGLSLRYIW